MFITLEEGANANLIVCATVFERNRRAVLGATLMGRRGKLQRTTRSPVIVEEIADLSAELKRVSGLDGSFKIVSGRPDEAKTGGGGQDGRERKT